MDDPALAFVDGNDIRINFGVFAGREATPAEIDRLAVWLLDEVGAVSIVSEERHEIDSHGEAVVHQIRIEIGDRDPEPILARAWHWARLCVEERHAEITDGV